MTQTKESIGGTVRYLEQQEKQKTIPLWREAFPEDTEEFLKYYYEEKTRDNRILALEEQSRAGETRIVSMVHRNPYRLRLGGTEADIDYIVAVATAQDRRHRGFMRKLLVRLLEDMRREGMPFCFLMPADPKIYEPFGFAFIYDQEHWKLTDQAEKSLVKRRAGADQAGLAAEWSGRWLGQRYQVYAARDKRYVERLLRELASEQGWMEFLFDSRSSMESPAGIRCWWGLEKTEQRMLLCGESCREDEKEPSPAIMARIADVRRCLELLCLKKSSCLQRLEVILHVEDQVCLWNQGEFLWKLDHRGSAVVKAEGMQEKEDSLQGRHCLRIGIENLTQWIFGYRELEEIPCQEISPGRWWQEIGVWKSVFLDEVV